jgi:drug/metabolite transporter (DMT)-like permease
VSADSDRYTFGVMLVAALAITPVALLSGQPLAPVRPADWFWLALLALVPGTGHLLFNFAHRFVDVSVSSVVSAGSPIVASLLALLVLGERLDAIQVAGGIVAVLAIAAVAYQAADPGPTRHAAEAPPSRPGEQAVLESEFVPGESACKPPCS